MRNLWLFLFRNRAFFWFLVFEGLCVYLVVKNNNFQGAVYKGSANRIAGTIYEKQSKFTDYLFLRSANEQLAKENARLREQLKGSFYDGIAVPQLVVDTLHKLRYSYIVAKVINNSTSLRNNYLTMNKGSLQGIAPGMGIIGPTGIIGIVKEVSPHFSTAISLLHKDSHFSARLKRTKDIGSLIWNGIDSRVVSLKDVPNHVEAKAQDTVETSGFSLFPEGIAVGKVIKAQAENGESALTISIKLFNDFNNLQYVYIVNDKLALEQKALEVKEIKKIK